MGNSERFLPSSAYFELQKSTVERKINAQQVLDFLSEKIVEMETYNVYGYIAIFFIICSALNLPDSNSTRRQKTAQAILEVLGKKKKIKLVHK